MRIYSDALCKKTVCAIPGSLVVSQGMGWKI